jgi:hypothetical protein
VHISKCTFPKRTFRSAHPQADIPKRTFPSAHSPSALSHITAVKIELGG